MKLYHGTSSKYLKRILKGGIKPRGVTGESNWEAFPSMDTRVYLSSTYPLYFAAAATNFETKTHNMVVFEIDTDKLDNDRFYPDEDFIAQALVQNEPTVYPSLEDAQEHAIAHIVGYKHHWTDSLEGMGNISHHGAIPVEAITRYAVVDHRVRPKVAFEAMNPTITPINHMIKGEFYKGFVDWVFADKKALPQVAESEQYAKLFKETGSKGAKQQEESVKFWKKESRDRTGVEVFVM